MLLVNDGNDLEPPVIDAIDKITDSEIKIKLLKNAGFKEFTVQLNGQKDPASGEGQLKIVDDKGKFIRYTRRWYKELDDDFYENLNKNNPYCEYINLAHDNSTCYIKENMKNDLYSAVILNKNVNVMGEYGYDKSLFNGVKNRLTFYCKPGSKSAIDILDKYWDEEHYPEFYNATIVFMSPKLVADYQKNLDDVDDYREMKEFIKSYEEKKDYFSFKLSECSNQRIAQLLFAQTNLSDTWEKFVAFMEEIGVKEKIDVKKDVEHINESVDKNDKIGTSDNQNNENQKNIELIKNNEKKDDEVEKSDNKESKVGKDVEHANESTDKNDTIGTSDNQNNENQKNIELMSANEKKDDEIEKLDNKNKIESKLEDKRKMLTQNYNLGENVEKELTQNVEIKKTIEEIDEPEEHLCSFMRYLKNHWPRIFKVFNTIRCSFSRFIGRFKNKSKNDDKNSLGNIRNKTEEEKTQNLLGRTSALSSYGNRPKSMENQSVIHQKNEIE